MIHHGSITFCVAHDEVRVWRENKYRSQPRDLSLAWISFSFCSTFQFYPSLYPNSYAHGFSRFGQSGLFRFIHFFVPKVRSTTRPPFSLILLAVWPNCPPPHIGGMNISLWKKKAFNLGPAYSICMTFVSISVIFILVKASQLNELFHHLAQIWPKKCNLVWRKELWHKTLSYFQKVKHEEWNKFTLLKNNYNKRLTLLSPPAMASSTSLLLLLRTCTITITIVVVVVKIIVTIVILNRKYPRYQNRNKF